MIAAVMLAVLAATGPVDTAQASARAAQATVQAAQPTKMVRYHGVRLRVPTAWPVFRLGTGSSVCVRFNRHAVYLGEPGANQVCPRQAIGRTEAILVAPQSYRGRLLTPLSTLAAGTANGSMARVTDSRQHVVITATWDRNPNLIRRALGLRSLRAAMLATNGQRLKPARVSPSIPARAPADRPARLLARTSTGRRAHELAHQTNAAAPATPGAVYAGLGFDVCSTPSTNAMAAWGASSPYAAIGIYIGGANAACLGGNLNSTWVSAESAAGWRLIPIYVGLQAPGGCCKAMSTAQTNGQFAAAAAQGTAAAQDAVYQAQLLGIGTANPIYYDMENYTRSATNSGAVLAFLQAWTQQLHASGYLSGVYSSGSSGITDLVASYGTTYAEPDELWTASWYSSAPATPPTSATNVYVPAGDWACNNQLLQYYSDPTKSPETYGGVTIGIDRDYVDAATAAYGSGTLVSQPGGALPSLAIKPFPDGSVQLTPSAGCEVGTSEYTILAGTTPTALSPIETVSATTTKFPLTLRVVYPYYEVQALNSLGQVMATSAPIQAPSSVAIFGHSAYVGARGPVGIPAACLNVKPCRLEAQIFDGKRRIAESNMNRVSADGGQLLVPMSPQARRRVTTAAGHHLPVTVTLTSATGAIATRPLTLIGYTISGKAPKHRTWPSSVLQVLGSTSYVSNAYTGGVLAACRLSIACVSTVRVTLGGKVLASARTTTLGPGEVGYLTYTLNKKGHKLLRAEHGNQLGARLTVSTIAPADSHTPVTPTPVTPTPVTPTPVTPTPVSTTPAGTTPPASGGASIASVRTKQTMALISLVSFR